MRIKRKNERGALLLEVLIAVVILEVFAIFILSSVSLNSKLQRSAKERDTANYTAAFAARMYKVAYCSTGVQVGQGEVYVSDDGIAIFKPAATTPQPGRRFRFRASGATTPTGQTALNFQILGDGDTVLSGKIVPVFIP